MVQSQSSISQSATLTDLARVKAYDALLSHYQEYDIDAIAAAADFLREQDSYQVALPLYQYLLTQLETADFHYGTGQCYGKTYQYQSALFHLNQAFQLQNDRVEGANYYAYILERNQCLEQAAQFYEHALNNGYDRDLWTLSHYAYFLEKCHNLDAAEQTFEKILRLNPTYTWAVKRYALFLLKHGQADRSFALMQEAIDRDGENPFVQLNYLEYLILREEDDEYERYLRSIAYDQLALPFQLVIDLMDYFWRYLLIGQVNSNAQLAYRTKAAALQVGIHRDFDDLTERLTEYARDVGLWQHMIQLLLK